MTEKYYIVENKEILDKISKYKEDCGERNKLFTEFADAHGIDGDYYYFGANGEVNQPFPVEKKDNIRLYIERTKNNLEKFEPQFCKARADGLSGFKKNSEINREFQTACVEKEVVINLYFPRFGDCFKELHLGGYSRELLEHEGKLYLGIRTENKSLTPEVDGFIEIKGSEYFTVKETMESSKA